MPRRLNLTLEEAVAKGKVEEINRHLRGSGYQLHKNPSSVTVTNEEGEILFRSRSPKAAMERIKERQDKSNAC